MAAAPARTGPQQWQRDAAEGRPGIRARGPGGTLQVRLGAGREAGHHDEVGDRRRLHAQDDDDAQGPTSAGTARPSSVVEEAAGTVGVQPADRGHVAGHDEGHQHGQPQAAPAGHVRPLGDDGQARADGQRHHGRRRGSSRAKRRWLAPPTRPPSTSGRQPILEGGLQQRQHAAPRRGSVAAEQQGDASRTPERRARGTSGRAPSARRPWRRTPGMGEVDPMSVTEDGAVRLQQLRLRCRRAPASPVPPRRPARATRRRRGRAASRWRRWRPGPRARRGTPGTPAPPRRHRCSATTAHGAVHRDRARLRPDELDGRALGDGVACTILSREMPAVVVALGDAGHDVDRRGHLDGAVVLEPLRRSRGRSPSCAAK